MPAPAVGLLGSSSAIDFNRGVFYATMPLSPSSTANTTAENRAGDWLEYGAPLYMAYKHWNGSVVLRTRDAKALLHQPPPPPAPKFEIDLLTVVYKGPNIGTVSRIKMDSENGNSISTCS